MEQIVIISSILIWVILLANLFLTFAVIRKVNMMTEVSDEDGNPMTKIETLEQGQIAPPFNVETLDGKIITLVNYAHHSIALLFITPKCEPCRKLIPTLETLASKAKQSNITLLLVILADKKESRDFVDEFNLSLPILVAPSEKNSVMSDYKVGGTPFYCLIDEQGKVEATGFLDKKWHLLTGKWGNELNIKREKENKRLPNGEQLEVEKEVII